MLQEHKKALIFGQDLRTITNDLQQEERDMHQQRLKAISDSETQALLFYECLKDAEAGEAGTIARSYMKTWAAKLGIDLEELRKRKDQETKKLQEILEADN